MSFHDTFMIFIIITINNVMIIITLCPEATSSCNRCFFNVRCPCQPPHRHQWDTAPSPSPGHVTRAWAWRHVSGDTSHVRGGGMTGLDWVLLCSVVFGADSSVAGPHRGVGGTQPPPPSPQLAGPTSNIWRAPEPSSLHYQACEYAGPLDQRPPAPLP